MFFVFKQKTAYEMRISDWSSDVCSSDLVLGFLTLSQTCHGIDRAIIGLVLAPVGKEFGLSDGELGFLAGFAYGIFFAIAALPFGIAVDRYNRRNLMTIALTMWSGATALCGLAVGFWTLFLGRAAVGTAEAAGSPTGMSLLSDYFDKAKRSTAIGIRSEEHTSELQSLMR